MFRWDGTAWTAVRLLAGGVWTESPIEVVEAPARPSESSPNRPALLDALRSRVSQRVQLVVAVVVVLAGVGITFALSQGGSQHRGGAVQTTSAAVATGVPAASVTRVIRGLEDPSDIAVLGSHVWVTSQDGNFVVELSARTGAVLRKLSGPRYGFEYPKALVAVGSHLWVVDFNSLKELDATTGALVRTVSGYQYEFNVPFSIAYDDGLLWVANQYGPMTVVDASTGALSRVLSSRRYSFSYSQGVIAVGSHVWVANSYGEDSGDVTELDARDGGSLVRLVSDSNRVMDGIRVFDQPQWVAIYGSHGWVTNTLGTVTEFDVGNGRIERVLDDPSDRFEYADSMALVGSHLWITNQISDSLTEVNAVTGAFEQYLPLHQGSVGDPIFVAARGGRLWVASARGDSVTEVSTGR